MIRSIILSLFTVVLISCGGDSKKATTHSTTQPALQYKFENTLPALPQSVMEQLFREATYVDYIFYDLPFSLSQDNQASIHANLKLISSVGLENLPQGCKPIGREFFHIGGEIAYEADLYFSSGCIGYVFLKDEKPIYGSKLTEEGMKFYTNIISQSKQISAGSANAK